MKRFLILFLLLGCGLLCGCSQSASPSEGAVPSGETRLPSPSASEENSSQWTAVLYFRYLDYPMLAGESRVLTVLRDESSEAALLRALLDGPSAQRMNLRRALNEDVTVTELSSSGETLFVTLSASFLQDGVPDAWESDDYWAGELPARRRLAVYSLVNTVVENLPYTRVQILIDGGESAGVRLDQSYFLTGKQGPADLLRRDESLLLTPSNSARLAMEAWKARDYQTLFDFVSGEERPSLERFQQELDVSPALGSCEVSAGAVDEDGQGATVSLDCVLLSGEGSYALPSYPLRLRRENGVWKIPYDALKRLMLR